MLLFCCGVLTGLFLSLIITFIDGAVRTIHRLHNDGAD